MDNQKGSSKAGIIYGYYEIKGDVKLWHPNPMLEIDVQEQMRHNCALDPNFRILETIEPLRQVIGA